MSYSHRLIQPHLLGMLRQCSNDLPLCNPPHDQGGNGEMWTDDGSGTQCVSGLGGVGADCSQVTLTCHYHKWFHDPIWGDGPKQPDSSPYDTTQTTGYCE